MTKKNIKIYLPTKVITILQFQSSNYYVTNIQYIDNRVKIIMFYILSIN